MTKHIQSCKSCSSEVEGELYHLGFSDMESVYCSSCPNVLLIKDRDFFERNGVEIPRLLAGDSGWMEYDKHLLPYYEKAEKLLPDCECGGDFKFMAPPRCPKCNNYLSGKDYDNKPYYRNNKHAFVTTGSIYLKNGVFSEST